jgi:hypothetical protein
MAKLSNENDVVSKTAIHTGEKLHWHEKQQMQLPGDELQMPWITAAARDKMQLPVNNKLPSSSCQVQIQQPGMKWSC